jgi:hypothetical protein
MRYTAYDGTAAKNSGVRFNHAMRARADASAAVASARDKQYGAI